MGPFSRRRTEDTVVDGNANHDNYDNAAGYNHGANYDNGADYNNGVNNGPQNGHDKHRGFGRGRRRSRHHDQAEKRAEKRAMFDIDSGQYNRKPSFGQWIKMTWLDILTMFAMGLIGLGIYEANPAPSRSFPITFKDGEIVYPQFAYPLRNEIVPIWLAALLASIIPIFVILCMQWRIRSFWDVNNAIIGLLYSLISAAVFQVFVKWLIGGLRPHFLSVCDPDPALLAAAQGQGKGFTGIMFQRNVCRGDQNQINDSLESMPSGHSTAAWAGFLYLYFYLNAKMKVFSNHHPAMWKLIALYAPVLGATLITGSLTIDEFHNWYDCLAGAVIGSVMAISAYRMVYASVWDFRFNHIPLTRHTPFSYGAGEAGAGGFESAVFTRKAGWGYEEALGGAPFDAAHGLRGKMAGFNTGAHDHQHHGGAMGGGGILGHNKRNDDIEHNAAGAGAGATSGAYTTGTNDVNTSNHHHHHNNETTTGATTGNSSGGGILSSILPGHHGNNNNNNNIDNDYNSSNPNRYSENYDDAGNNGRYHHHSRSMERKALPTTPGATARRSGEY